MREITDEQREIAWESLREDFKWIKEQLNVIAITRQQIGNDAYYVFHFGADDYLELAVEEALSQAVFRKRIYAATGYPCPKETGDKWDRFCALIYIASGNPKILDTKTAEIEELLAMYLQGPHTVEVPADDDAIRESLSQMQAGIIRAIWYSDRWIFRIDDLINYSRKNWQDIKRADMIQKLSAIGFERGRTDRVRYWQSPVGFGPPSVRSVMG